MVRVVPGPDTVPSVAVVDSTPDAVAQRHREGLASGVAALRQADAGDRVRLIDPDRLCRRRHRNRRQPGHRHVDRLRRTGAAVAEAVGRSQRDGFGGAGVAVPSLSCKRREVVIHLAQRAADGQGSPGGGLPVPPVAVADSTPDAVAQRHREDLASGGAALRQADAGDRVAPDRPRSSVSASSPQSTGSPATVTAIVCAGLALLLPKLSVAFSVMVSGVPDVAVPSVSFKRGKVGIHLAQRAADGQGSPGAGTPCLRWRSPTARRTVAQRHREGLASGVAALRHADAGDRVRLIDPDRLCRRRHRNHGSPATVTAIVCAGLALLLPKLSVAVSVMVSGVPDVAVPSLSCKRGEVVIHLAQRAADGQGSPGAGHPCLR